MSRCCSFLGVFRVLPGTKNLIEISKIGASGTCRKFKEKPHLWLRFRGSERATLASNLSGCATLHWALCWFPYSTRIVCVTKMSQNRFYAPTPAQPFFFSAWSTSNKLDPFSQLCYVIAVHFQQQWRYLTLFDKQFCWLLIAILLLSLFNIGDIAQWVMQNRCVKQHHWFLFDI